MHLGRKKIRGDGEYNGTDDAATKRIAHRSPGEIGGTRWERCRSLLSSTGTTEATDPKVSRYAFFRDDRDCKAIVVGAGISARPSAAVEVDGRLQQHGTADS